MPSGLENERCPFQKIPTFQVLGHVFNSHVISMQNFKREKRVFPSILRLKSL
jgi:hypothetical protein